MEFKNKKYLYLIVCIGFFIVFFSSMVYSSKTKNKNHTNNVSNRQVLKNDLQVARPPSDIQKEVFHFDEKIKSTVSFDPKKKSKKESLKRVVKDAKGEYGIVSRVVDGDTFDILIHAEKKRVRVIGINTPETVDPRKKVQCFGKEASKKAYELLFDKKVRLESDPTQDNEDKYHRLLRYVYVEDDFFFNKSMIEQGYAHEYTYEIPYLFQKEFKSAEQDARIHERGLWSPSTCNGES